MLLPQTGGSESAAPLSRNLSMEMSLVAEGRREADAFKWIESQKAGYDLGEAAIRCWVQEHWNGFLRARWIQHLEGTVFWTELGHDDFGFLKRKFQDKSLLLSRIADQLKACKENLDIIVWSIDWNIHFEDVFAILLELDINGKRLIRLFDCK
jgi:hypothetical protein